MLIQQATHFNVNKTDRVSKKNKKNGTPWKTNAPPTFLTFSITNFSKICQEKTIFVEFLEVFYRPA